MTNLALLGVKEAVDVTLFTSKFLSLEDVELLEQEIPAKHTLGHSALLPAGETNSPSRQHIEDAQTFPWFYPPSGPGRLECGQTSQGIPGWFCCMGAKRLAAVSHCRLG